MYRYPEFGQKTIHSKSRISVACQATVWLICMSVDQVKRACRCHFVIQRGSNFSAANCMDSYGWLKANTEFAWTPQHALPLDSELGELQCPAVEHEELVQARLKGTAVRSACNNKFILSK